MDNSKKIKTKHQSEFNEKHVNEYGLKITARDANTKRVSSVACLFCIAFGREDSATDRQRKKTSNTKYWDENSFRSDYYLAHMKSQHPLKWNEYQQLEDVASKSQFFISTTPRVNTILAHFTENSNTMKFMVNSEIVETIIGGLIFHPEDDGVTYQRAMDIFAYDCDAGQHFVFIKKPEVFRLALRFLSIGNSFKGISKCIQAVKEETGIALYGGCTDVLVSNYAQFICAVSLQKISEILTNVWAFSLAFDVATHQCHSYLDIRVRFCWQGHLENYHLIALPLHESHSGENMCKVMEQFLDALIPNWRKKVIGLTTDGARSMTGHVQGLVTRIQKLVELNVIRVWCGLHQVDLVMQSSYEISLNSKFTKKLTELIGFLRRQYNLISEMKTRCPSFSHVRWLSMGGVLKWLKDNQTRIQKYLVEKKVDWAPNSAWWIYLHVLHIITAEANETVSKLQALTTHLPEQAAGIQKLKEMYMILFNVKFIDSTLDNTSDGTLSFDKKYFVQDSDISSFIENINRWCYEKFESLSVIDQVNLVHEVGVAVVKITSELAKIVAERDGKNNSTNQLPPILPHQLVKLDMSEFIKIMKMYESRLKITKSEEEISKIDTQFAELKHQFKKDVEIKRQMESMENTISFEKAWEPFLLKFPDLVQFCGGIASAFANTGTVESDFSVVVYEKDKYRSNLTDLSLEGILHSKQFKKLVILG